MSLHSAILAIKDANTTLNALVGQRFSWDELKQGTALPCIRLQVVSRIDNDKVFNSNPTFSTARVQMDCYAATSIKRTALRDAVIGAFQGYSGTIDNEVIQRIRKASERETKDLINTNVEAYRISIDFMVPIYE